MEQFDVAIAGGGPAGLTAAMTLSRSRFKTVVLESPAPPRNAMSLGMHGIVGLDGLSPAEYRARAWADLGAYGMAWRRDAEVDDVVSADGGGFTVVPRHGEPVWARRVLLATGMVDDYPEVEGFRECWGKTVIHCPFCGGWENGDRPWGVVVATAEQARVAAAKFAPWSQDVLLFGNGADPREPGEDDLPLVVETITRLHHADGDLRAVELADGTVVERRTLVWRPRQRQVPLVERLGLVVSDDGFVKTDEARRTSIPGVYAAGDLTTDWQTVVTSVHAGSMAAYWMLIDSRDRL
ncbi:Thioredoxin reductase [Sinosporangium album]|uniref:Thioredoxin reductase n=1 Tax=Sinosporangium album TaxID=504805 RepID=A0A1G7UYS6_9ACTN|nr:NAD(P)/FAD-dependent oxidoreductase [Sinosporangium album]SDG52441.1 Thioredoxin reductase [Sinosporangium album]